MAEQRTRLFVDEIQSVALVERGANVDSAILIAKRAEPVEKIIREEGGKFSLYSRDGKKLGTHKTRAEALAQERAIEQSKKEKGMSKADEQPVEKSAADRAADAEAQVEVLTAQIAELKAQLAKPATPDEVIKTLPEDIRKIVEDSKHIAEEALAKAAAEESKRLDTDFVAKAAELIAKSYVPAKAEEFGPVLKRIERGGATEADFTELYRVIKALGEQVKTGLLFKSTGRTDGDGESAAAAIHKAAEELRKVTPMSMAEARVEARRRHPDLARRERAEQGH